MIVYRQGSKPDEFPAEIQGVQRVKEMKILGVIASENLSVKMHFKSNSCQQTSLHFPGLVGLCRF